MRCSVLRDSFGLIALAREMRDHGELPRSLALWAVENPLLERDAARLQRKVRDDSRSIAGACPAL